MLVDRPAKRGPKRPSCHWGSRNRGHFPCSWNGLECRGRSLTGAWIETSNRRRPGDAALVAPSRERGSKPSAMRCVSSPARGRSLTGAWIETDSADHSAAALTVAPSRERGSKQRFRPLLVMPCLVAPSRERGSKRDRAGPRRRRVRVAPSRERGSKPSIGACSGSRCDVAPSRERGSKQVLADLRGAGGLSLPHGSVDRNKQWLAGLTDRTGRSLTGAWIRNWEPWPPAPTDRAPDKGRRGNGPGTGPAFPRDGGTGGGRRPPSGCRPPPPVQTALLSST